MSDLASLIEYRPPLHVFCWKRFAFRRRKHRLIDEPGLHRRPGGKDEQRGSKHP